MRGRGLHFSCLVAFLIGLSAGKTASAEDAVAAESTKRLERIDGSLKRALEWLAGQQKSSGEFPTEPLGQPGITSLCVMAFMSQGHLPATGQYGGKLDQAVQYVVESQKQSGLIARAAPDGPQVPHNTPHELGRASAYNHAISALMLSEAYGMMDEADSQVIKQAIEKALVVTLAEQRRNKPRAVDLGGWRYLDSN